MKLHRVMTIGAISLALALQYSSAVGSVKANKKAGAKESGTLEQKSYKNPPPNLEALVLGETVLAGSYVYCDPKPPEKVKKIAALQSELGVKIIEQLGIYATF